jgi:hypothetical protein
MINKQTNKIVVICTYLIILHVLLSQIFNYQFRGVLIHLISTTNQIFILLMGGFLIAFTNIICHVLVRGSLKSLN